MFRTRSSTSGSIGGEDAPRRVSVTAAQVRTQAAGAEPVQQTVKVAVMPPRLPQNMAPPTGLGAADTFGWDESINWSHNQPLGNENVDKPTSFKRKIGLTTQRKKRNEDLPNFTFREVPYDIWRKHYAKDKDGNYHGTLAPAEDCILKPEDVAKWRFEPPKTRADLFTRGSYVLPVYEEAEMENSLPAYSDRTEYQKETSRVDSLVPEPLNRPEPADRRVSNFTADGRTTEQIIKDAEEKAKIKKSKKESWKDSLRSGANMALLGTNLG